MRDSLYYIQTRHPYGEIEGQPSQAPEPASSTDNAAAQDPNSLDPPPPENPGTFDRTLHTLAQSLILKEQQIEYLIEHLPGIDPQTGQLYTQADQEDKMRALQSELTALEAERAEAEVEREKLVEGLGEMIVGIRRVP